MAVYKRLLTEAHTVQHRDIPVRPSNLQSVAWGSHRYDYDQTVKGQVKCITPSQVKRITPSQIIQTLRHTQT
jgi:hypothetical protein